MMSIRRPNIPIALLSLFLSIGLWIHVQSQSAQPGERSGIVAVRLEPRGLDSARLFADVPKTVYVNVDGTPDQINQVINSDEVVARVDLSRATPGRHTFDVTLERGNVRVPITLVRTTMAIDIERQIRRTFPVTVATTGQMSDASTLSYSDALVRPAEIVLFGPESQVQQVDTVRALLDLSKVEPQKDFSIPVDILDKRGVPLPGSVVADPPQVTVRPALMPKSQDKAVIINANFQGHPAFGYRVTGYEIVPNQVFVSGSSIDIARITTVETRPINIEGLKETSTLQVQLALPEGITIAKQRNITVKVFIEPVPPLPGDTGANPTSTGGTGGQ